MEELTQQTFEDLLDAIARRSPTPGGGAVAAACGALASAMGRMVVAYSANKKTTDKDRERVDELLTHLRRTDELLRGLASLDASAYQTMTQTAKRAQQEPSDHQNAVVDAIAVPMEIAALSAQSLTLLDGFKDRASRFLLSDLGVSAVLAEAAAQAAGYCVRVNLPELTDRTKAEKIRQELATIAAHCAKHRNDVTRFVNAALEPAAEEGR